MSDRIPTFADLCSAIAEGHIPATIDGSMYQVNLFELRRYFTKLRSMSTLSTLSQSSPSHTDASNWPGSAHISVA